MKEHIILHFHDISITFVTYVRVGVTESILISFMILERILLMLYIPHSTFLKGILSQCVEALFPVYF